MFIKFPDLSLPTKIWKPMNRNLIHQERRRLTRKWKPSLLGDLQISTCGHLWVLLSYSLSLLSYPFLSKLWSCFLYLTIHCMCSFISFRLEECVVELYRIFFLRFFSSLCFMHSFCSLSCLICYQFDSASAIQMGYEWWHLGAKWCLPICMLWMLHI